MSHALRTKRGQFTSLLVIAAAAVALLLAFQGTAAKAEVEEIDSTCISERFCMWKGTNFNGEEINAGCGSAGAALGIELKSARNNCGSNMHIGWEEGGVINWKACMAPGTQHGEPGRFNRWVPGGC
jgi:hypothetical protein